MSYFNGLELNAEAFASAKRIEAAAGCAHLGASFNIAPVKSDLRRLYTATGGERSTAANKHLVPRDPTADEYRAVFNGDYANGGADVLRRIRGEGDVPKPEPKPEAPKASMVKPTDNDAKLAALAALLGGQEIDEEAIRAIANSSVETAIVAVMAGMDSRIEEAVAKATRIVTVKVLDKPDVKLERTHKAFEEVLSFASQRQAVMLVGPAGSGKTTLAEQVAQALGLEFFMAGKTNDEVKITGYRDGSGGYRDTAFRRAYENGGVFLFDEIDGWSPDALIAVNAPLAGNWGDFPDGMIRRHPDFVAIAAGNTYGRGADRQYVGREQLDAATLDRFAVLEIDYDEALENAIACDAEWTKYVQKVRAAVAKEKVRHIVSPRASIAGGIMIKAGHSKAKVEEAYIWKGLDETQRNRVKAAMR